ncbi:MAG: hypothetical protein OWQ48_04880 [Desulfurococcus sp.]|nr:hypothetical protein [Desulfurococcus sp.]
MSGENIPRTSIVSIVVWLLSIGILMGILLLLGFSSGVEEVLRDWPAHIAIVVIVVVLEVAAFIFGKLSE